MVYFDYVFAYQYQKMIDSKFEDIFTLTWGCFAFFKTGLINLHAYCHLCLPKSYTDFFALCYLESLWVIPKGLDVPKLNFFVSVKLLQHTVAG